MVMQVPAKVSLRSHWSLSGDSRRKAGPLATSQILQRVGTAGRRPTRSPSQAGRWSPGGTLAWGGGHCGEQGQEPGLLTIGRDSQNLCHRKEQTCFSQPMSTVGSGDPGQELPTCLEEAGTKSLQGPQYILWGSSD